MPTVCLIDEHFVFSYAGFYSLHQRQIDWKLESKKKMETSSFFEYRDTSQATVLCLSANCLKDSNPYKIFLTCLSV